MKMISGFPQCIETTTGKFIWNDADSKYGVDIPAWKQIEREIICSDDKSCTDDCKSMYNGVYINGKKGKKCYSYKVMLEGLFLDTSERVYNDRVESTRAKLCV